MEQFSKTLKEVIVTEETTSNTQLSLMKTARLAFFALQKLPASDFIATAPLRKRISTALEQFQASTPARI